MKPVCIIPARGGSKGIPKKNIRKIGGKPLIAYTIKKAKKSKIFSHIVVSTEDKEIALIAKRYGAEVPFMRPKYLATDSVTTDDVLVHAVKELFKNHARTGGSIFLSTHSMEIAEELCGQIAIILRGRIKAVGDMESLRQEASLETSDLEEVFLELTETEELTEVISALKNMD